MSAALELDGSIGICGLWAGVLGGQPEVSGRPTLDARYRLMRDLGLATAASANRKFTQMNIALLLNNIHILRVKCSMDLL